MVPIASSEGVGIHCPKGGRYSFFNSPFPAHRLFTGLDIYPPIDFGELSPSPVGGEIIEVRKVRSPRSRYFKDPGYDVVILLKSFDNPSRLVKMLHVEPVLGVGEELKPGQELGTLFRSGYYGFGTGPHIHLEIRPPTDPLRVRGGFTIERNLRFKTSESLKELRGVVIHSVPERTFLRIEGACLLGFMGNIGGVPGLLDGGVPIYGWLGAHYECKPITNEIRLAGVPIAEIIDYGDRSCTAVCQDFVLTIDGIPIWLFMYLNTLDYPFAMVTGRKPGELLLEEGQEVEIVINLL
jgi:hypothetical protein